MMQTKPDRAAWLKAGTVKCNTSPGEIPNPHRFVLLGAPGVGKGTQAELLAERLGACHLSTGDVFRTAKTLDPCECTPSITRALAHMQRGELVPDQTVLDLVAERSKCLQCGGGFLLDGFPRTVVQAMALDKILLTQGVVLDAVFSYEMSIEKIVARLAGRRTCCVCRAVFHAVTLPPKMEGVCDHCGSSLIQRQDDRPESVRVRMEAYETNTAPLVDFYRKKKILIPVSAEGTPEEIYERTISAFKARLH